ncbi:hypothetical protein ACQR10_11230 [Bradyrhizobium sp. HKCCYLRH2060]|uniref:hypothetical protein n=1 Tax=Bradyrhizobium TaxID=374 RepID=UPI0028E3F4B3|nr:MULTISPECIES: hypothetical protein [unclassified Bradyrhizobium]
MIIAVWNEVLGGVDLMVDTDGVDVLIDQLTRLKTQNRNHLHIYDVGLTSPWGHKQVAKQIVINWIGEPDLFEEEES